MGPNLKPLMHPLSYFILAICSGLAPVAAAETALIDLSDPAGDASAVPNVSGQGKANETDIHFAGQGKDRSMVVACQACAGGFPGVVITPLHGSAWDLSGSGYIEASVSNPGAADVMLWIRADNAGDWKKSPWDTEQVRVGAGCTVPVRVTFGRSMGKQGYALDAKAVTRVLLFELQPTAPATFVVHALVAGGKAGNPP